jgi:two-component system cell cycle response regulator DivK
MERRSGTRPQRILIVEDSEDIRHMWKAWLTYWGFQVDEAANGAEAVHTARLRKPSLVLMDLWMPVLDGFNATVQLKSDPRTADVPVLATSANADPPAPERARMAGCDVFMPKPVDPDELLRHLRLAFRRIQRRGGSARRDDFDSPS